LLFFIVGLRIADALAHRVRGDLSLLADSSGAMLTVVRILSSVPHISPTINPPALPHKR
jgi:hypothetical protein